MSLILTASPWISGDSNKKRIPSNRKTIKKMHNHISEPEEFSTMDYSDMMISDGDKVDNRNSKVNELLEKMTSINIENDGGSLANFVPLSYPTMDEKQEDSILSEQYNSRSNRQYNPESSNFVPENIQKSANSHGDLNNIYDIPTEISKQPYYTSGMGIGKGDNMETKMMDRLGYIAHLLEQQQDEKTNNVLEEYVLYVLLGTFVIFIVDSFSRGGKYIR
jgi:hypothetical protein